MRIEAKMLAFLDRATRIPCIAMRMHAETDKDSRMFSSMGFGASPDDQYTFFYFPSIGANGEFVYHYGKCSDSYTCKPCAKYVHDHWESVSDVDAIDARRLRMETDKPKTWEEAYSWQE